MNIIFLDFDGPLFSSRAINFMPENKKPYPGKHTTLNGRAFRYWRMDPMSVEILNRVARYIPLKVVISSSWKNFCSLEAVTEIFELNGLELEIHEDWKTKDFRTDRCSRINEILEWLGRHSEVINYIIIDDRSSGSSIYDARSIKQHLIDTETLINLYYQKVDPDTIIIVDEDSGLGVHDYLRIMDQVEYVWKGEQRPPPIDESIYACLIT